MCVEQDVLSCLSFVCLVCWLLLVLFFCFFWLFHCNWIREYQLEPTHFSIEWIQAILTTNWNASASGRKIWDPISSLTMNWMLLANTAAGCTSGPIWRKFTCPKRWGPTVHWIRTWPVGITLKALPSISRWKNMNESEISARWISTTDQILGSPPKPMYKHSRSVAVPVPCNYPSPYSLCHRFYTWQLTFLGRF